MAAGKAKKDAARKAKKENLAQASDTLSARHAARKLRGETSTKLEYDGAADADPYATSGKGKGRGNRDRGQVPASPAAADA